MVHPQVAALVFHLGGKNHSLSFVHPVPDALEKAARLGEAAHAEALDNEGVVAREQKIRHLPARTGHQLQKGHLGIQRIVKYRPGAAALPDVAQQHAVPQHPQLRKVDAGKSPKTLGPGLFGPGAQNHLAVKDNGHPRQILRGAPQGVRQVHLGVCGVKAHRLLGSRKHDGLGALLNEVAEGRRRIGHGIGAVGDDEPVIVLIVFPDALCHLQPVGRGDVGAVQIQKLQALHPADLRHSGQVG